MMLPIIGLLLVVLIPKDSFQNTSLFEYKVAKGEAIGKIEAKDIEKRINKDLINKSTKYDLALRVEGKEFYKGGLKETYDLSDNNELKKHSRTAVNKLVRFRGELIYQKQESCKIFKNGSEIFHNPMQMLGDESKCQDVFCKFTLQF